MKIVVNIAVLFVTLFSPPLAFTDENQNLVIYEKEGEFADVREDLVDAIINQGYVIDYNGRPGEMLKRTRKDVGGQPLYLQAE